MKRKITLATLATGVVLFATPVAAGDIDKEIDCLAKNIYFEARNEGPEGNIAVAFVTMNRVESDEFPDSVCDVVWQPRQFSWTHDGKSDKPNTKNVLEIKAWKWAKKFAALFVQRWDEVKELDITEGSTFYHSEHVEPFWSKHFVKTKKIGSHVFYKKG